jgi:hypothetical protein
LTNCREIPSGEGNRDFPEKKRGTRDGFPEKEKEEDMAAKTSKKNADKPAAKKTAAAPAAKKAPAKKPAKAAAGKTAKPKAGKK